MSDIANMLPFMLEGAKTTLQIFFLTLLFSIPLGMIVMFLRNSRFFIVSRITKFYILVMRGTPLMLQTIFIYFAPYYIFGSTYDRFVAVIIAFSVNYAAYFAELFRSGLMAVDSGQIEAAKSLGLNRWNTFRYVVLKQMIKPILPAVCSEFMALVKDTSLAQVIAVSELFRVASNFSSTMVSTTPLFVAGVMYLVINTVVEKSFTLAEKKLSYF